MIRALTTIVIVCIVALLSRAADAPPPQAATQPATQPATRRAQARAPLAVTPLRPFTAFSWAYPGVLPRVKSVYWLKAETPPGVAAQATSRMAEGSRVVLTVDYTMGMFEHPDDVCRTADGQRSTQMGVWPENGSHMVLERWDRFLDAFTDAGGKIDFLALDQEGGYSTWGMTEARLDAIQGDPRFPPLARELGFSDARRALFKNDGRRDYLTWSAVMQRHVNDANDRALFEPLRRHFPRAGMSNFNAMAMAQEESTPDINGHPDYQLGEPPGTHQSPGVYGGAAPHVAVKADWERPFIQVVFGANWLRAGVRSSNHPMIPWLAFKNFVVTDAHGRTTVIGNTDYWEENAWHAMLNGGTSNAFFWNPTPNKASPLDRTDPRATQPKDNDAMEAVMAEYEREAKEKAVTSTITTDRVPWDAKFLVSAVRLADGTILGRVTFAEDVNRAEITLAGKSMTIDRPAGKLGVWVRVP